LAPDAGLGPGAGAFWAKAWQPTPISNAVISANDNNPILFIEELSFHFEAADIPV
jgi:hypothetical protein